MEQRTLKFTPASRRTDPASSRDAAKRAAPRASSDASRVLAAIEQEPGQPARSLARTTGLEPYVVRKRTADLRRKGLAHSHEGDLGADRAFLPPADRELRWFPGTWCRRCSR